MKLGNHFIIFKDEELEGVKVVGTIMKTKEDRIFEVLEIDDRIGFVELLKTNTIGELDRELVEELKNVWDLAVVTEQMKQNFRG